MNKLTWAAVRPIVTLMFAGALVLGFFIRLIPSETAVPIFASAVTWWFTARDKTPVPPVEPPK